MRENVNKIFVVCSLIDKKKVQKPGHESIYSHFKNGQGMLFEVLLQ
jgi:hypothetical protein